MFYKKPPKTLLRAVMEVSVKLVMIGLGYRVLFWLTQRGLAVFATLIAK